jgi:hypothetical protein
VRLSSQLTAIAEQIEWMFPEEVVTVSASPQTMADVLQHLTATIMANPALANTFVSGNRSTCMLVDKLSTDCVLHILTFLPAPALVAMSETAFAFYRLINRNDHIWRTLCLNVFPQWHRKVIHMPKPNVGATLSAWRALFVERSRIDETWWHAPEGPRASNHRVIHCQRGVHAVYFDDQTLMLGSGLNNEIVSYDLKSGTKHTGASGQGMYGHSQAVTCFKPLAENRNILLTGSLDGSLRLFNRERMAQIRVFNGHSDKVWCIEAHGDRVFSGSSDKTIRIWNSQTGNEVTPPLQSHRTSISSLRIMPFGSSVLLMSGSAGNTIRAWDLSEGEPRCIAKLRGHAKGVFCLQTSFGQLFSGSLDNVIKVWDPRQNFRLVYNLFELDNNGQAIVSEAQDNETKTGVITFQVDDTKVVSGGPDHLIKVWDLRMRRIVRKLAGHTHWVTTLQFDESKIVSGSRDKTLRFWDINGDLDETVHTSLGIDQQLHLQQQQQMHQQQLAAAAAMGQPAGGGMLVPQPPVTMQMQPPLGMNLPMPPQPPQPPLPPH